MMKNKNYKYFQPNKKDLKDKYGDCVIRSFVKTTGKDWLEVFDELMKIARNEQAIPNGKLCYEIFLKENGFKYTGVSNKKGSKRPTVLSFTQGHTEGVYVLIVANHIVASVDGVYYDTWDSGQCSMYGYWEKQIETANT